jgi:hypothetical protein
MPGIFSVGLLTRRPWRRLLKLGGGSKEPVHDLRDSGLNALEALHAYGGEPCILTVRLDHCRWAGASGVPYGYDSPHPYVQALRTYLEQGDDAAAKEVLSFYWSAWRPGNAAEYLRLDPARADPLLKSSPPAPVILPWTHVAAIDYLRRQKWMEREDYRRLVDSGCPPVRCCGPKPTWFIESRYKNLVDLCKSIRTDGYRDYIASAPVKAYCLIRGRSVRYVLINGQHRLSVLSALGHTTASVLVNSPRSWRPVPPRVRADDVEAWPFVRERIMSAQDARRIFDIVFDGIVPEEVAAGMRRAKTDTRASGSGGAEASPSITRH